MPLCSIDGCARPVKSKGWCAAHYMRWYRKGNVGDAQLRIYGVEVCDVEGCEGSHVARGKCALHLNRLWRLGTVELPPRPSCQFPGCTNKHYAKNKCRRHYDMARYIERETIAFPAKPRVCARPLIEHIRSLHERGRTTDHIAAMIGCDRRTVQRWLTGRDLDSEINRDRAEAICERLEMHPATLFDDWLVCKHGDLECVKCGIGVGV